MNPFKNQTNALNKPQSSSQLPNLKQIRKQIASSSSKSERRTSTQGDTECSFNLTAEEEAIQARQRADQMPKKSNLKKPMSQHSQSMTREVNTQESEEVGADDKFLKELEEENKQLEEELRNLQSTSTKNTNIAAAYLPCQQSAYQAMSSNKKIRFKDENASASKRQSVNTPQKSTSPAPKSQLSNNSRNASISPVRHNFQPVPIQPTQNVSKSPSTGSVQFIEIEKYKSLELRLMGCLRTIKNLEKENKEKHQSISKLESDLKTKQKQIDQMASQSVCSQQKETKSQIQGQLCAQAKKKEKDLESKVTSLEDKLGENKKQLIRVQEVNKQLVDKVKDMEQTILERERSSSGLHEDVSKFKDQTANLRQSQGKTEQLFRNEKKKVDYLERECQLWKDKYDALKDQAAVFEEATQGLYESHIGIVQKVKQFVRDREV